MNNKIYISVVALSVFITAKAQQPADTIATDPKLSVALNQTVTKEAYTGALSTVDDRTLGYWQERSLKESLVGQLAGYYNNGNIRGINSPNAEAILIVLDGVPAPTVTLGSLDPKSIKSVSILKDAAAKALYGPMGAQGVILVNTKRGIYNGMKVRVNANFGWDKPTEMPSMYNAYDYATMRNQALTNDGLTPKYSASQLSAFLDGTGTDTDWLGTYMKSTQPYQMYNVELRGGSNNMRFYINAGFSHSGSLLNVDWKEKYNPSYYQNMFSIVSNMDVQIFPWLNAFANANVRIGHTNQMNCNDSGDGQDAVINQLFITPPTVEDGFEDGKLIADEIFTYPIYGMINYSGTRKATNTDVNASVGLNFDLGFITRGLSANATVGYNTNYTGNRRGTYNFIRYVRDSNGELRKYGSNEDEPLKWSKSSTMLYFMNFQALVKYERTFAEKHLVDAFVNYFAEDRLGKSTSPAWLLPYSRIQLGGHVKYGFGNRYFAQFDFTYAGSEMMKEGNQFHFSPTYSLAWVPSQEAFLKDVEWLNLLKIRGSYGILYYDVLKDLASRYLYSSDYRTGGGSIGSIYNYAGITEGVLGNPGICWERSYQQNYGIDLTIFHHFNLSADYWYTQQKGVIFQNNRMPAALGVNLKNMPYENIGKVRNYGVDASAEYLTRFKNGLRLNIAANFGWNENKIIDGADIDYTSQNYAYPLRVSGYAIGQKWGYLVDYSHGNGYFNSQSEIDNCGQTYIGMSPRPGDLRYIDLNKDGRIDEADKAPLEGVKKMPSFNYGLSVGSQWKGFDLYIFCQAETGRNNLYSGIGITENTSQGVYNDLHAHAWTAERYADGEYIAYPTLTTGKSSSLENNNFFTSKADFFRLKNVTVGYSLPESIIRKIRLTKVRFYFTGQNLATATNFKYKGIDPEKKNYGDFLMRSFNFGLNIEF